MGPRFGYMRHAGMLEVPDEIQRALGLLDGDAVKFVLDEGVVHISRIGSIAEASAGSLRQYAIFNPDGSPLSAEQLKEISENAWAEEAAERDERSKLP